ncbi:MAG: hypothetical protein QXG03_13005 [Halalkalicoccus sp.]
MSKISEQLANCRTAIQNARRTVAHSPSFPTPEQDADERGPPTRIVPGGGLTG